MTGKYKYYRKHPEMRKKEREKREKRKCKNCGKVFRFKHASQKYCCLKCQRSYNDKLQKTRQYEKLSLIQGGVCAICKRKEIRNNKVQRLEKDHDHKTGKFRGLLCKKCNMVLGFVNDDIGILKRMIKYLENN